MIITLNKKDKELLTSIAIQKVLTVSQLSTYYQRSRQAVRRRIRFFSSNDLETIKKAVCSFTVLMNPNY